MSQNDDNTHSFLELVAEHEKKLRLELEKADRTAESIIDEARAKARQIMDDCQQALQKELAEMEEKTETVCRDEQQTILADAEERIARRCFEMMSKVSAVAKSVFDIVLPQKIDTGDGQ